MPPFLSPYEGSCLLHILLVPNAKENKIYGLFNERLKLYISAPAVDGKANKALIKYLADLFNLKKNQISLIQGEKSHQKTVRLDAPIDHICTCLSQHIPL